MVGRLGCRSGRRLRNDFASDADAVSCSLYVDCGPSAGLDFYYFGEGDGTGSYRTWGRVSGFLGWGDAGGWEGVVLGCVVDEFGGAGGIFYVF